MLSKLALGQAARFARASRVGPVSRALPVASTISVSPWIRTYAKGRNKGNKSQQNEQKPSSDPSDESQTVSEAQKAAESKSDSIEPEASKDAAKEAEEQIPFDKLPDLTQGIPSTLADEMDKAQGRSKGDSSLQTVPQYERQGGGRDSEYVSTTERNRRWWTRFLLGTSAGGVVFGALYWGRNWDDEAEAQRHPDIPNGLTPGLWWQRVRARLGESVSYYQDPAFDKLLPDPHPSFERPYTLVISLEDLLVHSEWSRQHGWRLAKRPGMDYFIRYLGQYYELVVWSSTSFGLAEGIVRKLDPFRFIMWPLFREATKFEDGEIVKVWASSNALWYWLIIFRIFLT